MKDKCFIYYGNPCTGCLTDPEMWSFEDAKRHEVVECPYASDPSKCSPSSFGCVRVAGARMARAVIQFYREASEVTLALDRDYFRRRGPLPPTAVQAYVDPERGFERITDPEQVVRRVWEDARAVLDLKPRERVPRQVGRYLPPASDVPSVLVRRTEQGAKGGQPGKVRRGGISRPRSPAPLPVSR